MSSQQFPESKGLFVVVLLASMLNTMIRESIFLIDGHPETSATLSVVSFVFVGAVFLGVFAIVHFVYLSILKHHYTHFLSSTIQFVATLFYYYGNGFHSILNAYKEELGCDTQCISNARITSGFSLGASLTTFYIAPTLVNKLKKKSQNTPKRDKIPDWLSALDMITVFVKMDSLYSTVVMTIEPKEYCNFTDITISVLILSVVGIFGVISGIVHYVYSQTTNKKGNKIFTVLTTVGLVGIIICFPLYILADNHQPLDCAFGCENYSLNMTNTSNDSSCNATGNSGARLGLTGVAFIVVFVLSITYLVFDLKVSEEGAGATNKPVHVELKEETQLSEQHCA